MDTTDKSRPAADKHSPATDKHSAATDTRGAEAGDETRMRAAAPRSRAKLLEAATAAFADNGADAPLEDIARRAGVGIGTLYRHFPTRVDPQAAGERRHGGAVCGKGAELLQA